MKQILVCRQCNAVLTTELWVYREVDGKRRKNKGWAIIAAPEGSNLFDLKIGQNCGEYFSPSNSVLEFQNPRQHADNKNFCFAIRPDTVSSNVKKNKNWKIECCGVYPGSAPNLSCKCGNPIGYEFGDCYTYKYIHPVMENTKWQNAVQ